MTILKSIGLAALASILALGQAAAQGKKWESIKIATEGAYAPYNFTTPSGKLDGFEVELANDLCARMKLKCEMIVQDWDGIIPALNAGKYDAIMAGMNITEKRKEVIAFTRPYTGDDHGFTVVKGGPLEKLPGLGMSLNANTDMEATKKMVESYKPLLKGKTVGVQGSTTNLAFLEKWFKDTIEIREYKTTEQHDLDIQNGRLDAIYASKSTMKATIDTPDGKDLVMAGAGFNGDVLGVGVGVGLRKADPELLAMFDTAIAAAAADGTIKKLSEKWFKIDLTPKS